MHLTSTAIFKSSSTCSFNALASSLTHTVGMPHFSEKTHTAPSRTTPSRGAGGEGEGEGERARAAGEGERRRRFDAGGSRSCRVAPSGGGGGKAAGEGERARAAGEGERARRRSNSGPLALESARSRGCLSQSILTQCSTYAELTQSGATANIDGRVARQSVVQDLNVENMNKSLMGTPITLSFQPSALERTASGHDGASCRARSCSD
jgi:hypothetical protein